MSTQPRPTSATAPPVHPTRPADPARPADAGRTVPPADTAPAPGTAGPRRATRVPPAAPGTRPLPPLTLALDPADTPACTRTALAAHDPARGQATVHPTPGTAHTADLAHDVMAALGKPDAAPSPWTTRPTLTWAAAAAHARAMRLGHLIVLRAHLLTPARLHQLLLFQQRTGAHLTLVCHRAPTPALTRALAHVGHSVTHGLPPYAHPPHPPRAATTVGAGTLPPRPATPTWLTLPALTRLAWPHTPPPATAPRRHPTPTTRPSPPHPAASKKPSPAWPASPTPPTPQPWPPPCSPAPPTPT
ncbi:hypothetical protein OHV05_35080 (plasmid) [Kitasatospora sp. NBC_00070]|uniref:hypothetical protein n=1 Tax=Kitasatospora sp. NBC_00070 TaxID=2975962 RepID=UPI002F91629B